MLFDDKNPTFYALLCQKRDFRSDMHNFLRFFFFFDSCIIESWMIFSYGLGFDCQDHCLYFFLDNSGQMMEWVLFVS